MNKLKNIKAKNKLHFIIFSFILIVAFIVAYPTLCKILMKSNEDTTYWNGQIATSFKEGNGTSSNPYIISTPEEFALLTQFDTQTESYYEITNDLYLNEGVFEYKDGNIIPSCGICREFMMHLGGDVENIEILLDKEGRTTRLIDLMPEYPRHK